MLTRSQADVLCTVLDVATESNWHQIASEISQRADPKDVVRAWKELEAIAGRNGGVPDASEFDL